MLDRQIRTRAASIILFFSAAILDPANALAEIRCPQSLSDGIPRRVLSALPGSELMSRLQRVGGKDRDHEIVDQVLSGNVPDFLRRLTPVNLAGTDANGEDVKITLCVTPEYLAVGSDGDFVRVPMGLPAAARIANETGFLLPTSKMVDAIYAQAQVRLTPQPMKPTSQMESTDYLVAHNRTLDAQRAQSGQSLFRLTAGQKKDIVLTKRLRSKPGRVAIYGWHRTNGKPIQPLSTVHGAAYADYSHGVRLVSRTAFVNGRSRDLAKIISDRELAYLVSSEGPIDDPERLLGEQY